MKAEKLLHDAPIHSLIYKSAKDFVYGRETCLVKSYNTMNIFQDKSIMFRWNRYD